MALSIAFPAAARSQVAHRTLALAPHLLIFAAIGVELLALGALLPRTFDSWRDPAHYGYGDFRYFYESSRSLSLGGTYNPSLGLLLHPLTYLSLTQAFRVYLGLNAAALLAIAYLAQRPLDAPHAKVAMALGVLAMPQAHWALRVGHFTEILALVALLGFLLSNRRPVLAGVLFATLALKPQYLPVPVLYLLYTRNWRALGALAALFGAASIAGVVAAGVSIGDAGAYYIDRVRYVLEDMVGGKDALLLPVQESWQYSWRGFLVSAGIEPNPMLIGDLLALSAVAMLACWWRCTSSVARVAAALGMLLLAPYSTFYNWSMIAVAAALLVRSDLRPRWLIAAILAAFGLAAVASQAATPFPAVDRFATSDTRGLYWMQPVALLTLFVLAINGRGAEATAEGAPRAIRASMLHSLRAVSAMPLAAAISAIIVTIAIGYLGAAYVSHNPPFAPKPLFSREAVVGALPADFPLPNGARIDDTGEGAAFPYRIEWRSDRPVSEVAGIMQHRLGDGSWSIKRTTEAGDTIVLHAARDAAGTDGDVVANVSVEPSSSGARIAIEFSPLPPTRIANYDRWLEERGIVVKNVSPEDYDGLRKR
jgi:hypothetical protein